MMGFWSLFRKSSAAPIPSDVRPTLAEIGRKVAEERKAKERAAKKEVEDFFTVEKVNKLTIRTIEQLVDMNRGSGSEVVLVSPDNLNLTKNMLPIFFEKFRGFCEEIGIDARLATNKDYIVFDNKSIDALIRWAEKQPTATDDIDEKMKDIIHTGVYR